MKLIVIISAGYFLGFIWVSIAQYIMGIAADVKADRDMQRAKALVDEARRMHKEQANG